MAEADPLPRAGETVGWLVVYGDGMQYRALMLDHARAVQFAAQAHGIVFPLGVI